MRATLAHDELRAAGALAVEELLVAVGLDALHADERADRIGITSTLSVSRFQTFASSSGKPLAPDRGAVPARTQPGSLRRLAAFCAFTRASAAAWLATCCTRLAAAAFASACHTAGSVIVAQFCTKPDGRP
jgi:hypothetical protein